MRSRVPLFALLFAVGSFALPFAAHAAIPFFGPIVPDSINRCAAGWGSVIDVINRIIEFLITLVIVFVAPIMIAYSGFLFVVNPVNAGGKEKAKGILLNTVIGIIVALAGWMIVDAVMVVLYNPGASSGTTVLGTWSSIIYGDSSKLCLIQEASLQNLNQTTNIQGINGSGLITSSSGTLTGASGLNVTNAVNHLDAYAQPAPTGYCAMYVRQALVAGGFTSLSSGGPNAKDYGPLLTNAGFSSVSSGGYTPQIGDVIVFQPVAGHPDGHIEMYDGSQWVSDYKQGSSIYPATAYQGGSYAIYRA